MRKLLYLATLAAFAVITGCGTNRWAPADPDDPNRTVGFTGIITHCAIPKEGEVVIHLRPRPEHLLLLAEGQDEMICEMYAWTRRNFELTLKKVEPGKEIEIHGYFVLDRRGGPTHKIRPITAIDIYPEPRRRVD